MSEQIRNIQQIIIENVLLFMKSFKKPISKTNLVQILAFRHSTFKSHVANIYQGISLSFDNLLEYPFVCFILMIPGARLSRHPDTGSYKMI